MALVFITKPRIQAKATFVFLHEFKARKVKTKAFLIGYRIFQVHMFI